MRQTYLTLACLLGFMGALIFASGHVAQSKPIVRKTSFSFYVPPGMTLPKGFGQDGNLTNAEVQEQIIAALNKYEAACGVVFTAIVPSGRKKADLTFEAKSIDPAGQYGNGVITIDSTPAGIYKGYTGGALTRLSLHEVGHFVGWGHVEDDACVMSPNAVSDNFCPAEVQKLVKRFGP